MDLFSDEDYKKIIKAVLDSALVDYTKLQHSKNRNKKFLEQSYKDVVAMFFDKEYTFQHFLDLDTEAKHLSLQELLSYFLDKNVINMKNIHAHVAEQSTSYWWEKNFHDLAVPESITISGIVWTIINSPTNTFIDHENKRIYCASRSKGGDRIFFSLCLELMLTAAGITLTPSELESMQKLFYLFLKINSPLKQI